MSIAQALVDQVEAARQAHGGGRVVSIDVQIGEWQAVVPEILTGYFDYLAQGTPLEGARIFIEDVVATARCGGCGLVFESHAGYLPCPSCGSVACSVVAGKELHLTGVELDD